jgi:hypothetical protein
MTVNNLVLPSDNAVFDYSVMSQVVNAINDLQAQINKNAADTNLGGTAPATSGGGTTPQLFQRMNRTKNTGPTMTLVVPDMTTVKSIVPCIETGSAKIYAVVRKIVGATVTIELVGATKTGNYWVHWIASGY